MTLHKSNLRCRVPGTSGGSGVYILGASGVAIIAAGGTDLYCHSEPPLTSGKLCFIINFIGGHRGARIFTGGGPPLPPTLNRPCQVLPSSHALYLSSSIPENISINHILWEVDCMYVCVYKKIYNARVLTA